MNIKKRNCKKFVNKLKSIVLIIKISKIDTKSSIYTAYTEIEAGKRFEI